MRAWLLVVVCSACRGAASGPVADAAPVADAHPAQVLEVELAEGRTLVDGKPVAALEPALVARLRQGPTGRWRLRVDPAVPFGQLREAVATAEHLRLGRAQVGDVRLGVYDGKKVSGGLELTLFVTADRLVVYSLSEGEGTLRRPALEVKDRDLGALGQGLRELARRHPEEHQLIIVSEPELPAGQVLPVLQLAQAAFPDLVLSAGIM